MGLYDRDYLRDDEEGEDWNSGPSGDFFSSFGVVHYLILANVLIWIAGLFTPPTSWDVVTFDGDHFSVPYAGHETKQAAMQAVPNAERADINSRLLDSYFALRSDFWRTEPWQFWRLLTHGFAHSGLMHLLFNMYGLYLFGRLTEEKVGRREFLAFYLASIVVAGLVSVVYHSIGQALDPTRPPASGIGASGGVYAVMVLYAMFFPKHKFRLIFAPTFPISAWMLALGYVLLDLVSSLLSKEPIAYEAHLGGAAFAFLYARLGMNFTAWIPAKWGPLGDWFSSRPQFTVYQPEDEEEDYTYGNDDDFEPEQAAPSFNLDIEGDRLLAKVHRDGIDSLSSSERQILEEYSRRLRRRRR